MRHEETKSSYASMEDAGLQITLAASANPNNANNTVHENPEL